MDIDSAATGELPTTATRAVFDLPGVRLLRSPAWSAVEFDHPRCVLSSAPVNGGDVEATRIVNLCVHGARVVEHCDDPVDSFSALAAEHGWTGKTVGMMTGVQASRLGVACHEHGDIAWLVLATVGCSNAHRAGEAPIPPTGPGTINIIAVTSAAPTAAARAEAVMLITEAKCAFLADAAINSANDRGLATGTGTDAVAVAGDAGDTLQYTGYHTPSGLALARATRDALAASLAVRGAD